MFLHLLTDNQKSYFLELAIKAAEVNGNLAIEEKNLIKAFSLEMGIPPIYSTESSLESILQNIKEECDMKTRKIIVFEILGILLVDSSYDEKEKEFLTKIIDILSISEEQVDQMKELLEEYADIYNKISQMIL